MKKILLSFAVAMMAITAFAQEKEWNISDFDAADYVSETNIDGLTIYATETGKVSVDGNNKTVDGVKYTKRLKTGGAGSFTDGVYSRVISFDVPSNGTITLLATSSNSTDTRVVGVSFGEFIAFPAEGENPAGLNAIDVVPGNPQFFTVEYKGGSATKVYIYSKSGGVNFYDFKFTPAAGGDTPEPAEGEVFQTVGWGRYIIGTTFDETVTPFTFDAQTKEVTFKNFLGSATTVELKFELADSNKDPNMTGTKFNAVPVSGLGDMKVVEGYNVCTINDFNQDIVLKKDGVNVGKLSNVVFTVGYGSQIDIMTVDGQKVYNFTIMLGGDYSTWDAEKAEWVSAGGSTYLHLEKNVPFGPTSSIDEVAVDFDENAPVEYYNLQGVRVAEPSNGVFIKRQGNKVVKVLVK